MQSASFVKTKMSKVISKGKSAAALLAVMATTFTLLGSTASAGTSILYNQRGSYTNIYFAPTTNVNVKATVQNGTFGAKFNMSCWVYGQALTGNYYSSVWFYGQYFSTGSYGYVHSSYVYYQTTVPRC